MRKIILGLFLGLLAICNNCFAEDSNIKRVESYLNNLTSMKAAFVQMSQDGSMASGTFFLKRPGKLRWQYNPPTPITIVANGKILTYYDSELNEASYIPLDETLASFLTRKNISFSGDVVIKKYANKANKINITIAQKNKEDQGQVTLVFRDDKIELLSMETIDAVGELTRVSFQKAEYGTRIDDKLFTITKAKLKRN